MESTKAILCCRYSYDPLDRLISQLQPNAPAHQRFYCKSRLTTEIQGAIGYSIFQKDDLLLAQHERQNNAAKSTLLATDLQRSVLRILNADVQHPIAYSPYGHCRAESGLTSLLAFNGERRDPVTGHYLLGGGYRAFNPILMRFNSPDNMSPFGEAGLNYYSYCKGDPINSSDPSGHLPVNAFISAMKIEVNSYIDSIKSYMTPLALRFPPTRQRRLSDPGRKSSILKKDFMGYHGTSKESAIALLEDAVDPAIIEGPIRPGFYFSPDVEVAFRYGASRERFQTGTTASNTENIVEVHIQNLTGMTPGKDYDFNHHPIRGKNLGHTPMEFFVMPHAVRSITIRKFGSTPSSKKVRPRAHEAPF
jgi:RHS repeat-associated protein